MRLRPRSIRVRDTLIATVISVLAFGVPAVGVDVAIRGISQEHFSQAAEHAARRLAWTAEEAEPLPRPLPPDVNGVDLIQVVDGAGRVLNSTKAAAGRAPLSRERPGNAQQFRDVIECRPGQRCLSVHVIQVHQHEDERPLFIYAGREMPIIMAPGALELMTATVVLLLVGISAWLTWRTVGRTLEPIRAVRAQLAEISASDLSRRVPEPPGDDEIAELVRTANETLSRLEHSVRRQRQFTADASHELRTPVAGLRANLEDALMHPDDVDLEATLEAALRDTERLESIITDLLLLARLGTGGGTVQEKVDLAELVAAEVSERSFKIRTALASGVVVAGVPIQLVRLLANLLDNAECYAESMIEVEVFREGGKAALAVTDDGPGVPVADREQVFKRFTRLDTARSRDAGGTGLGLAIARDIASAHGGTLSIEDSPRGARFVLRLPLVP